jgi:primosomal protein N' (replication factor Y)
MDADTTREKFAQDEITEAFAKGDADVLVGTQMIAKGHNFPGLTLVGVAAADNSLFLDDFRASERTFSLITQVIGRAGRAEGGGVAVIQTLNPNNETIRLSAKQDYDAFYQNEIAVRRALVFPPFCDIAVFSFVAEEEDGLKKFAADFTAALHDAEKEGRKDVKLQIFGPFEAPIYKIKNKYRMRTVIKFKNNRAARTMFSELMFRFGKQSQGKIALAVDINPTNT